MALQREAGNGRDFILEGEELGKAIQKLSRDASKKAETLKAKADPKIREKLLAFCLSRGFEFDTCKNLVEKLLVETGV
jgi:SOS response regulatory protein OraA/RecX